MKKKVKKLGKGDKIASLIEEQPFDKEQAVNTLKSIGDITSAPQKSVTKLITGKYQSPSEAMKIDNFWGALATDVLLDPLVLIGMEKGATKLLSKEKFIDNIIIDPLTAARNRAERMISQKAKWSPENLPYTEDLYRNIDNNFVVDKAANWQHQPSSLGVRRGDKAVIFEDAPITPSQKKYIASHETGHLYSNSTEEANGWLDNFNYNQWKGRYLRGRPIRGNEDGAIDLTNLSKNSGQSVAPGNANEIRERAAQLKDYIAYKKKIPLNKDFIVTEKDLDDAIKNFTKSTGLDNNMTQMLSALKDKKGFLKQINLQPLGIVPAVGAGILSQNNTEQFKDGGKMSIHIKDSHKGRFTEYKKRTGKTTEEALHSKDPHVRQMANFARNAKKWNHAGEGDNIDPDLKAIPANKVGRLDSLAFRMRDVQADQTLKLINAHPDIPIREILMRAENDPSFRNRKINRMADSLTTLYGKNPYIPASEEFIHSADEYNKVINENGYNFNLLGENEDTKLQKFGWRSMLQKQLHRSSEPAYKVLEPLAKFGNGGEADEYTEWSQTNGMSDAVKPKNPLNFGMNDVAPLTTGIISGIQQLGQEKKKLQKARQWKAVSDVTLKASQIAPEEQQRMYVRPEDIPLSGEELFPMQGTGTNILARDGAEVAKRESTKVMVPKVKKFNQEEYDYYHPEVEKGITSGDKKQDFLYNNQWIFDVPVIGNKLKEKAYDIAGLSSDAFRDDYLLKKIGDPEYQNNYMGGKKDLLMKYFYKYFDDGSLTSSKYIPKSDYLTFLPSYSVKSDFDIKPNKKEIIEYAIDDVLLNSKYNTNPTKANEIYNEFIKNKKTINVPFTGDTFLTNTMGTNLAGHKEGLSWDKSVDIPYISVSDAWDFSPDHYGKKWGGEGKNDENRQLAKIQAALMHKSGQPFKIYDRFYFDPKTKEYISDDSIQSLKKSKGITPIEDEAANKDYSKYFTMKDGGMIPEAEKGWMSEGAIYDFASQGGGDIASKILSGIQGENGGATLGGTLGKTAGSIFGGPVGGMIGEVGGKLIGGLLDQKPRKIKEAQQQTEHNVSLMGINNASQGLHSQYSSFMKNGGKLGDHLTIYDGEAEPISYNPYMEDGGETILFKGPSHEEGGIPISYGNSPVEVEGGEPATKIDDSLVVFGNLPINKEHASLLNDPKAKGMKFKNYITSLSKEEQRQNGIIKKSAEKAGELSSNSFDTLTLSSMKANVEGAEYKLKQIAQKKQNAAFLQEAINKTAEEKKMPAEKMIKAGGGVKVKGTDIKDTIRSAMDPKYWKDIEDLPKFKYIPSDEENIKMAYGMEDKPYPGSSESSSSTLTYIPPKKKEKIPYADILNSILPYVRPTDAEPLDSRQLLGEMYALSNNQLEPVKAQTYIPTLETPYTLSLQDVLDQNNSDFRSLERTFTQNPEALSALSAQKYQANQKVLGEQFRINQENKARVYSQNRQTLNDTQLKNLSILDNQYERQERAKSNTKQTTQDALSSIASKYLQNQAENRTLQAYENLYNYRFDDSGRAINWNGVPTFNTEGSNTYRTLPSNEEYIYNSKGEPIDIRKKPAVKKTGKNGIIVKSLKKI